MERVLHINDYPIESGGGAEVVMRQTIDLLRRHGLLVETFTSADLAHARRTILRYVDNSHARRALAAKLEAFQPDVVHLHNYYHVLSPGILDTLARWKQRHPLRVIMTAHDYHLICPNAGGSWFRWWTRRREAIEPGRFDSLGALMAHRWDERTWLHSLLKLAQHVWNYRWHRRRSVIDLAICPSRFVQAMVEPTGLRTCWLPHPVAPPTLRDSRPRTSGPLHFIFVGRIEPEKGLYEFLQMLPDEFDAQLTIVGAGSDRARCEATCAARELPNRVEFVGRLPHAETLARIAAAHVLVQPSRVLETYGLTLIEALSAGTNILTSSRGALREVAEDTGAGFLFDVDEPASLAVALAAIRRRHAEGSLNTLRLDAFLEARSETRYLQRLLRLYQGDFDEMSAKPRAA